MRPRSLFMVLASALLVLATGGPASIAQNPVPPGRIPQAPPPQGRSLFNMFWQIPERPAVQQRQPRERLAPVQRRAPTRVVVRDDPVIPKSTSTTMSWSSAIRSPGRSPKGSRTVLAIAPMSPS
jgi:hypothetical protein